MDMICPECMGTLETTDGQMARCTTHGGEFCILYSRWRPPIARTEPPPVTFELSPGALCYQHRSVPAAFVCGDCGAPICATCAFQEADGKQVCPNCISRRAAPARGEPELREILPAGAVCVQHKRVPATRACKLCGAYMCGTCDFQFPGDIHVCPACAAAPRSKLSSRRKKMLIGSYALAVFSTFGMSLIMSGALAEIGRSKEGMQALGVICMIIGLVPSLVGVALGFSVIDRRLANPMSVWIATIWNGIIVAVFLLLTLVGIFSH